LAVSTAKNGNMFLSITENVINVFEYNGKCYTRYIRC
jgi:hypothetical protein